MSECAGCNYETVLQKYKSGKPTKEVEVELCNLCANTPNGNAVFFPDQYQDAHILKTLCYIGNAVLDKLKQTSRAHQP